MFVYVRKGRWSYGSVEERSVHTGKVAGSIPARTTILHPPAFLLAGVWGLSRVWASWRLNRVGFWVKIVFGT